MKILALSTNYKFFQDVLQSLENKGIESCHVTCHVVERDLENCAYYKKNQQKINFIEGTDFYDINKLRKITTPEAPVLDSTTLKYFEDVERDFYILTDRYDYFPHSFRHRKRLFRMGLRYWLNFFSKNKVDAVFSICTPHNFPDFLAFHVAKFLGIKTVFTTDVMLNDHVLFLEDYRERFKTPTNFLSDKSDDEIKKLIRPSLLEAAFAESNEIAFAKKLNDKTLGISGLNETDDDEEENKIGKAAGKIKNALSLKAFQPKFKATFAMNGVYSSFRRRLFRMGAGRRLSNLKKSYEKFAVKPDLSKKYVYFAMHLNPERTSQPEAEIFEDHLLAVEIIAKSIPDDWLVYVKENPSQYGRKLNIVNGKHYRDESDYADFARLKNVRLIRQDVKSSDLIESAQIISTLKGSVGWEAIKSGKPALIFANSWYSAHPSAFRANSVDSCKQAMKEMDGKTPKDIATDTLKFLAYMQDRIVIGSMGGHHNLEIAQIPYDEMVGSYVAKLVEMLNEKEQSKAQKIPA